LGLTGVHHKNLTIDLVFGFTMLVAVPHGYVFMIWATAAERSYYWLWREMSQDPIRVADPILFSSVWPRRKPKEYNSPSTINCQFSILDSMKLDG
jgi:hypothetical protein